MKTYTLKELVSTGSHARMVTDPSVIVGETYNGYDQATILDANATISTIKTSVEDVIGDAIESLDTLGEIGTAISGKQDVINDLDDIRSGASAGATALQPADIETLQSTVSTISDKIPSQAASDNQLADKSFVNSSISTNTADFKGTYDITDDLSDDLLNLSSAITTAGYSTPNNNDYCFVITEDNDGNTVYDRYKYTVVNNVGSWDFEYSLNNSSFTSDQWGAISSGITSNLVSKLSNLSTNLVESTDVRNIVVLTQSQYNALVTKDANTEYNII